MVRQQYRIQIDVGIELQHFLRLSKKNSQHKIELFRTFSSYKFTTLLRQLSVRRQLHDFWKQPKGSPVHAPTMQEMHCLSGIDSAGDIRYRGGWNTPPAVVTRRRPFDVPKTRSYAANLVRWARLMPTWQPMITHIEWQSEKWGLILGICAFPGVIPSITFLMAVLRRPWKTYAFFVFFLVEKMMTRINGLAI